MKRLTSLLLFCVVFGLAACASAPEAPPAAALAPDTAAPSSTPAAPQTEPQSSGGVPQVSDQAVRTGVGLAATAAAWGGVDYRTLSQVAEAAEIIKRVNAARTLAGGPLGIKTAMQYTTLRNDGTGKYACPFKRDGSVSPWAEKAVAALAAGVASSAAAGKATDVATSAIASASPWGGLAASLFGGQAKQAAESKAQETGALAAIGGWDYVRQNSDLSFDNLDEYAVYMQNNYGTREDYAQALASAIALTPELKDRYEAAVNTSLR